ncbi:putative Long chronological lifespan protein 2 [Seiridium cardinale]
MRTFSPLLLVLAAFLSTATAQFGFFEQMFGGEDGQQQQQQQRQQPNVPSDSTIYRQNFESFTCDNYLCPDTLGRIQSWRGYAQGRIGEKGHAMKLITVRFKMGMAETTYHQHGLSWTIRDFYCEGKE